MRSAIAGLGLAACVLGVSACNDERPPPPAARFDRPNRVAFVCARDEEVLRLDDCRYAPDADDPRAMFALVTQSGRGEIAAVNLRRGVVLDARREIPGFTFQPVGESPTAVVVPPNHASHTYVASFGSKDVRVLRTRALLATVDEEPEAQRVPLVLPGSGERVGATAMILTPDESALLLLVPDAGSVVVLPLQRCGAGSRGCVDGLIDQANARVVQLAGSATLVAAPGTLTPSRYEQLCGYPRGDLPRANPPTLAAGALDAPPRPSGFAVDAYCTEGRACAPRILIADEALPIVHVLDAEALSSGSDPLRAPLVTGVPTTAVAVTPFVPRSLPPDDGATQYVYAIDATNGSVLVLEDGVLLDVSVGDGLPSSRIALGAGRPVARTLAVLTPTFDPTEPPAQYTRGATKQPAQTLSDLACTDAFHESELPARLRGVFLAVATSDGLVRIVDVHDMELSASDGAPACRGCADATEAPVLVRHHPRLAVSFASDSAESLRTFTPPSLGRLQFQTANFPLEVRIDGTTASDAAPGLGCMACGEGRVRVYPIGDSPLPVEAPEPIPDAGSADAGVLDAGAPDAGDVAGSMAAAPSGETTSPIPFAAADAGFDAAVQLEETAITPCPEDRPALVCASTDPWTTPEELYSAVYEGRIPGTGAAIGRFVPAESPGNRTGGLEVLTALDACKAGALGEEDMAPEYAGCENPPATGDFDRTDGDQLVVLSRPLGAARLGELVRGRADARDVLERCAALSAELETVPAALVAFEVRRTYDDRVVVHTALTRPFGQIRRYQDLADCYESPISFDLRAYHAFLVSGGQSGFPHGVRADAGGRCEVDPDGDPLLRTRARVGCTFENHSVQLRLGADGVDPGRTFTPGTRLDVGIASRATKLAFNASDLEFGRASVVVTDLQFSPIDERLYLVDVSGRGLLPMSLDPLPTALSSSASYR